MRLRSRTRGSSRLLAQRSTVLSRALEPLEQRILMTAFPTPLQPAGSPDALIYRNTVTDSFAVPNETDSFTLSLDGGQHLTIRLLPQSDLVSGTLQVLSPIGEVIAFVPPAAPGAPVVLQTVPTAMGPGLYTINAHRMYGDGSYQLEVTLNANVQDSAAENITPLAAVDLDGSSVDLGGGADRLAALGVGLGEGRSAILLVYGRGQSVCQHSCGGFGHRIGADAETVL